MHDTQAFVGMPTEDHQEKRGLAKELEDIKKVGEDTHSKVERIEKALIRRNVIDDRD